MSVQSKISEKIVEDVMVKLRAAPMTEDPFPHFFIEDFLPDALRIDIFSCFETAKFKTAVGGTPTSHIRDDSHQILVDFRDCLISRSMIPYLDTLFSKYEDEKASEIRSENHIPYRRDEPVYGFLHLTRHIEGATIMVHRDDYWGSYQFIFYFGDVNGGESSTTELVSPGGDLRELENAEFSKVVLKSYGKSRNGFLFFINQPNAFHCLSIPVSAERLSISGSVLHFNWFANAPNDRSRTPNGCS